jgi:acyl carrier protein
MENFITNLINQFDPTPTEEVTEDTNFRHIENYDSVTALSIIAMIEDEYDVNLRFADIKDCVTVGDLFNLIKSKQ